MNHIFRYLFWVLFVKPVVFFLLGLNIHHRERFPKKGPAVLVANHNSHLDTIILMSLFPYKHLSCIKPIAAADYFLRNKFMSWFSKYIIGVIPIRRAVKEGEDPLEKVHEALDDNAIVIFYPEGTRGEPEHLVKFKSGIAYLASKHPKVDVIPVFIYGAGKALPKGEALLVPFVVDLEVGEPLRFSGDNQQFIEKLEHFFCSLADNFKEKKQWH